MSEKRFIVIEEGVEREDTVIEDTITKERYNEYGVVELLNDQAEIIKRLVFDMDLIANTKLFSRRKLEEENEQMKKQLEQIPKALGKCG